MAAVLTAAQTVALLDKFAPSMAALIDAEPALDLGVEPISTFLTGIVMNTPGIMGEVIMAATGVSQATFEATPLILSAVQFVGICSATSANWPPDFDFTAEFVAALLPHSAKIQLLAAPAEHSTVN